MSGNADLEKRFITARDAIDDAKPQTLEAFYAVQREALEAGYAVRGSSPSEQCLSVTARTKTLPASTPKEKTRQSFTKKEGPNDNEA